MDKNLLFQNSLLLNSTQKSLIQEFKNSFPKNFKELSDEFEEDYFLSFSSSDFQNTLSQIFNKNALPYSSLSFQFSHFVEEFLFLAFLHSDSEREEFDILDFWQNTIFNKAFMELFEKDSDEEKISKNLKHMLENQILSYFFLHLNNDPSQYIEQKGTLLYPICYEFGDHQEQVYVGEKNHFFSLNPKENPLETFPSIPIHYVPLHKQFIEIDFGTKIISQSILPLSNNILSPEGKGDQDQHLLHLHDCSALSKKDFPLVKEKVSKALAIIREASPRCYFTFTNFTSTLVPIEEKNIVSYSSQFLPGFSSINFKDRDFVDLMDDLVHENGHHYLNHFLNLYELIIEDDEQVFYSPWRRSLRPVRGIYHAVFTFFWATKLFSDLGHYLLGSNNSLDQTYCFSEGEKSKIFFRFIEEYNMLIFCEDYIHWSFKEGKVTKLGYQLILSIYAQLKKTSPSLDIFSSELKEIDHDLYLKTKFLKDQLDKKKEHYTLA